MDEIAAGPADPRLPLTGICLIDFTFQAAGPYATMLLAALGAEVIKIESNVRPDPTRGRENRPYVHSVFFEDVNLGKKSVAINMKTAAGVEVARQLIGTADAVTDNFRPGVLARWGLSPDALQRDRPRLVFASLSSAGSAGPLARLPGYAGIFNALGGLGGLTGYPGGPPTELRTSVDMRVGSMFATAVLYALLRARRTGSGPVVDFSAAEAVATVIGDQIARFTLADQVPARGAATPGEPMTAVLRCRCDTWLAVSVPDLDSWRELRKLITEVGGDAPAIPETYAGLLERGAEVTAALQWWSGSATREEVADACSRAGAICGPVMSAPDIASDSQHGSRGFFGPVQVVSKGKPRLTAAAPWLLPGQPRARAAAPALGEHTRQVIAGRLSRTDAEIDDLVTQGVLA